MTYHLSSFYFTNQDDIVPEYAGGEALINVGSANSLDGNDIIKGTGDPNISTGLHNYYNATINTGNGKDMIIGIVWTEYYGCSIYNGGSIETGDDDDYISSYGKFENYGIVSLGDGDDRLEASTNNYEAINNNGSIYTGKGKDSLIADGGAYNGDFAGTGNVFLGEGEDYLKGFGTGYYEGGDGEDSLELPQGSYSIIISSSYVHFIRSEDNINMQTSGFEKLIANGTTYNFTSLTDSQTIFVY
jgi:hypothetical protein